MHLLIAHEWCVKTSGFLQWLYSGTCVLQLFNSQLVTVLGELKVVITEKYYIERIKSIYPFK